MKKTIKSILTLILVAILSTTYASAYTPLPIDYSTDEEYDEFYHKWLKEICSVSYEDVMNSDYSYRWTVEVQLPKEKNESAFYELSDDGKLQISFIQLNESPYNNDMLEVLVEPGKTLIALKGEKELVLPLYLSKDTWEIDLSLQMRAKESFYKNFTNIRIRTKYNFNNWETDKDKAYGAYIVLGDGIYIKVGADEFIKAQDTTIELPLRRGMNIGNLSINSNAIEATAVTYSDMKKPVVADEVFFEAAKYSGAKRRPLDIPVEDMRKAPSTHDLADEEEPVFPPKCSLHDHSRRIIVAGSVVNNYQKTFPEGKIVFNITIPKKYFSDISSDGSLTVILQNYKEYSVSRNRNVTDLDYTAKDHSVGWFLVTTLVGDLGEKKMYSGGTGDFYCTEYYLEPICYWGETMFQYKHNRNCISYQPASDEPFIYLEHADGYYYVGIKTIGIKVGEQYYSIPAEEALIDYDAEAIMTPNSYPFDIPTIGLLNHLRSNRTVNNELENIVTDEMIAEFATYPPKGLNLQQDEEKINDTKEEDLPKEETKFPEKEEEKEATENKEDIKILLDKLLLDFSDQTPILEDGRILVPMRAIFEALGATVEWSEETQTVTATKGDMVITLQIGKNEIVKNGETSELDTEAQIVNDRTLVPLRAVSESFDNKVEWNGEEKTVTILTDKG